MPQISKIRIVNFQYNDGKRLIADELYAFSSLKRNDAQNVLINLANGGGKSVLVQLMLQPIIPKAKVAERRIESFFTRASDHCFVLLEWCKDNSDEKLLTGIAMAASSGASREEDTSGGMAVKYYTFYANYENDASQYGIVNLPLSAKESGRFVAADFDAIRALSKKSSGALNYYSSDDSIQWQKKLSEYGLIQEEWHMMEQLNSEEGGLGKFFEKFRSSDQLLDKLLIPAIETKQNRCEENGDATLTTMLLSYVRQYRAQQTHLQERERYVSFYDALRELKPQAEGLWDANDRLESSIAELFGFSDALAAKLTALDVQRQMNEEQKKRAEEKKQRIEWEKISADYHTAEQKFSEADATAKSVQEHCDALRAELTATNVKLKTFECARFVQKLTDIENEMAAFQREISLRESGGDTAQHLSALKYSVFTGIHSELPIMQTQQREQEVQQQKNAQELFCKEAEQKKADTDKINFRSTYDQQQGIFKNYCEETDWKAGKLNADLMRRLDGLYSDAELSALQNQIETNQSLLVQQMEQCKTNESATRAAFAELPEQRALLTVKQNETERLLQTVQGELAEYRQREDRIQSICRQYNLDFDQRFSDKLSEYLSEQQRAAQANVVATDRRLDTAAEAISAAEKGAVHVPHAVIRYLDETGVRYKTCEKYLMELTEAGKISVQNCQHLLELAPAVAYSVMMEHSEIERLRAYGHDEWLPAMVPIIAPDEMELLLQFKAKQQNVIAFYAADYFEDRESYISNLYREQDGLKNKLERLHQQLETYHAQLADAEAFSYSEDFYSRHQQDAEALQQVIAECESAVTELDGRRDELTAQVAEAEAQYERLREQKNCEASRNSLCNEIMHRLTQENRLYEFLSEMKERVRLSEETCAAIAREMELLRIAREQVALQLRETNNCIAELHSALCEVDGCTPKERLPGAWKDLLAEYHALQSAQDKALEDLTQQLNRCAQSQQECQKEIARRQLAPEQYQNIVYREADEESARNNLRVLEAKCAEAEQRNKQAIEQRGIAKGKFDSASEALLPYGSALPLSDIGSNFVKRNVEVGQEIALINQAQKAQDESKRTLEGTQGRIEDKLCGYARPNTPKSTALEESVPEQYQQLLNALNRNQKELNNAGQKVNALLTDINKQYSDADWSLAQAVSSMFAMLKNESQGDRYYTLVDYIGGAIQNAERIIARIDTDLKEFDNARGDLVYQCRLQGQRIFEGLRQMANSSKVEIYADRPWKQMIRFTIPDEVNTDIAKVAIESEIDRGTREISEKMDGEVSEIELKKAAERVVGSRTLFRRYIGKDSVSVSAYKIDQNPKNGGYRIWEQTQINNSGAEKFVIYFAIILSLMNYARSGLGEIQDKELRSVLILDNPFGATSSRHILMPMFAISEHFRVQLICLSDINKSDVLNCFNLVIRAIVRQRPMSSNELLTHEGNELIEHGFYCAEQLSIL